MKALQHWILKWYVGNYHMIQQSHSWVYIQRKTWFKKIYALQWALFTISKACEMKVTQLCLTLCDPMDYTGHSTGVGSPVPFSRGSSQPRVQTQVSCIAGGFFTSWATSKQPKCPSACMDKEDVVQVYSGLLLSHKKNEIMPLAAAWVDLEIVITE